MWITLTSDTNMIGRKLESLNFAKGRSRSSSPIRCVSLLAARNDVRGFTPSLPYYGSHALNFNFKPSEIHFAQTNAHC